MPRFTLRDVLLAVALIVAGIVAFVVPYRIPSLGDWAILMSLRGSCSLIGAGVGALRQRKAEGALVGCAIAVGIWFLLPRVQGSR